VLLAMTNSPSLRGVYDEAICLIMRLPRALPSQWPFRSDCHGVRGTPRN